MARPALESFGQLAHSIYNGGLDMDKLTFHVKPHLPQEPEYHKFRCVQAMRQSFSNFYDELIERFDKVEVPGVIVRERR